MEIFSILWESEWTECNWNTDWVHQLKYFFHEDSCQIHVCSDDHFLQHNCSMSNWYLDPSHMHSSIGSTENDLNDFWKIQKTSIQFLNESILWYTMKFHPSIPIKLHAYSFFFHFFFFKFACMTMKRKKWILSLNFIKVIDWLEKQNMIASWLK